MNIQQDVICTDMVDLCRLGHICITLQWIAICILDSFLPIPQVITMGGWLEVVESHGSGRLTLCHELAIPNQLN